MLKSMFKWLKQLVASIKALKEARAEKELHERFENRFYN